MDQCLSCTDSGFDIVDDECVCDIDNAVDDYFIQLDSNECVLECPDHYKEDGSFCYSKFHVSF